MRNGAKIAVVVLLAVAVAATFALRGRKRSDAAAVPGQPAASAATARKARGPAAAPRLLELGSNRCMACQQMAAVLDALRSSQGEKLRVEFIDVMENPELGEPYKISLIPTQIFFDAAGQEIYRHVGFFSHDDILAKFEELGVRL